MEFPLISRPPNPITKSFLFSGGRSSVLFRLLWEHKKKINGGSGSRGARNSPSCIRASGGRKEEAHMHSEGVGDGGAYTGSTMEVTTFNQGFANTEFPVWEKIGAVVRFSYGIGIYAAMTIVGRLICSFAGIDCTGGFQISFDVILSGLGFAVPPILALLFILDDEVVRLSPQARAIRDVEDEELRGFFYGMSLWQFIVIVAASSVGEELFYRAAVQGVLADIFLKGTNLVTDARGMVSLTGMLPPFVPFAQAFAAVITAALTASLYYVAASPADPTYVAAPVVKSESGRNDLKKVFAAWYERRQMKKIYSPLLEGLLGLYLGFEWIRTDNILAPIITHGIYSTVILGHGLLKMYEQRRRLRRRLQKLKLEKNNGKQV